MDQYWWKEYSLYSARTGSRFICSPPPTDTDDDYILLVDVSVVKKLEEDLLKDGYKLGGSQQYTRKPGNLLEYPSYDQLKCKDGSVFHSYKKGEVNVILTCCEEYYQNFLRATRLCKELNLLRKDDRVAVFQAVCQDNWPEYDMTIGTPEKRRTHRVSLPLDFISDHNPLLNLSPAIPQQVELQPGQGWVVNWGPSTAPTPNTLLPHDFDDNF